MKGEEGEEKEEEDNDYETTSERFHDNKIKKRFLG